MGLILTLLLELLVALLRLLLLRIVFLIAFLLWLLELLLRLWRTKNLYPSELEEGCPPLTGSIIRRPDPCLYSQERLMEQGSLPISVVEWILLDDPTAIQQATKNLPVAALAKAGVLLNHPLECEIRETSCCVVHRRKQLVGKQRDLYL